MACWSVTDGSLSLPSQLQISENDVSGQLEICTSLSSGGILETGLVVTLTATDSSAGEIPH